MSQPKEVKTNDTVKYSLNSVPCRIRFSGIHKSIPQHFHKDEQIGENKQLVVSYLRGRKLHGTRLNLNNLKGHILLKQFDEITSLGEIEESVWFEREGHQLEINDKIKEFIQLSELIHRN